ncbi:hypothetical protein DE146DRAFT_757572 [Phaeosphaeria sp. MPI-PUGE-AT-0046c]|nr:hypothetical protein DE146DRAFT_757572 [Phaeosphaeria sp. MPI-PUGE-AT-0046c]
MNAGKKLPEKVDISDRSRKFWNGTYRLVSDGFTDEHEVYRAFDCYDELARAPTPLPPFLFTDYADEDGGEDNLKGTRIIKETPSRGASLVVATDPLKVDSGASPKANERTITRDRESSTSPLSDYPSDLSEWEVGDKTHRGGTKKKSNREETRTMSNKGQKAETPAISKTKQTPKRNTRGVAQKVIKSAKKASTPVVLQRQTGEGTSKKRSVR